MAVLGRFRDLMRVSKVMLETEMYAIFGLHSKPWVTRWWTWKSERDEVTRSMQSVQVCTRVYQQCVVRSHCICPPRMLCSVNDAIDLCIAAHSAAQKGSCNIQERSCHIFHIDFTSHHTTSHQVRSSFHWVSPPLCDHHHAHLWP